jgi:glycine betaine catabolism B
LARDPAPGNMRHGMGEWVTVANASDVPEGAIVGASAQGVELVVTNVAGRYHAVGAVCPHAGCSLATDGEIENGTIVCDCHGSAYDLDTGEVVNPPSDEPIPVYDVRLDGETIQVARRHDI